MRYKFKNSEGTDTEIEIPDEAYNKIRSDSTLKLTSIFREIGNDLIDSETDFSKTSPTQIATDLKKKFLDLTKNANEFKNELDQTKFSLEQIKNSSSATEQDFEKKLKEEQEKAKNFWENKFKSELETKQKEILTQTQKEFKVNSLKNKILSHSIRLGLGRDLQDFETFNVFFDKNFKISEYGDNITIQDKDGNSIDESNMSLEESTANEFKKLHSGFFENPHKGSGLRSSNGVPQNKSINEMSVDELMNM